MFKAKTLTGFCAALALMACSQATMPSRGLPMAPLAGSGMANQGGGAAVGLPLYQVVSFDALVPQDLLVSEADVYMPVADIVWHGDPEGDRYGQIEAIFETALANVTAGMTQGRPVIVVAQVEKFHGVTPKTRATVGGNFGMQFFLTVLDAATLQPIDGPRLITADAHASGGVRALREERRGITQKSVVLARLVQALESELAQAPRAASDKLTLEVTGPVPVPEGYVRIN